jgi:hypothetical protein
MGSGYGTLREIIGIGGSENKLFGASVERRAGSRGARRDALKRGPYIVPNIDPYVRRTRRCVSPLVFQLNDVGVVVDADGVEFAEDVLSEQAVERDAQHLAEAVEIHDGDPLTGPRVIG